MTKGALEVPQHLCGDASADVEHLDSHWRLPEVGLQPQTGQRTHSAESRHALAVRQSRGYTTRLRQAHLIHLRIATAANHVDQRRLQLPPRDLRSKCCVSLQQHNRPHRGMHAGEPDSHAGLRNITTRALQSLIHSQQETREPSAPARKGPARRPRQRPALPLTWVALRCQQAAQASAQAGLASLAANLPQHLPVICLLQPVVEHSSLKTCHGVPVGGSLQQWQCQVLN